MRLGAAQQGAAADGQPASGAAAAELGRYPHNSPISPQAKRNV